MTLNEAAAKYVNQRVAYNGGFKGECLSLIKQAITDALGVPAPPSGNNAASGYWLNFDKIGLGRWFTKQPHPQVGDIVVFNTKFNPVKGHIAIIQSVDSAGFVSYEQNNPVGSGVHTVRHNLNNIYGYLRPKQTNPPKENDMPNEGDVHNTYLKFNSRRATAEEVRVYTSKPWGAPDGLYYGKIDKEKLVKATDPQIDESINGINILGYGVGASKETFESQRPDFRNNFVTTVVQLTKNIISDANSLFRKYTALEAANKKLSDRVKELEATHPDPEAVELKTLIKKIVQ